MYVYLKGIKMLYILLVYNTNDPLKTHTWPCTFLSKNVFFIDRYE